MKIYYEINSSDYTKDDITCNVIFFDKDKDAYSMCCSSVTGDNSPWTSSYLENKTYMCCKVQLGYNIPITWSDKECHNILIVIDDDINNTHIFYNYKSFRTFWEELLGINKTNELKSQFFEKRRKIYEIEKKKKEIDKDFQGVDPNDFTLSQHHNYEF